MACIGVLIPVRTVSEANARGHWSVRSRRAREQRWVAHAAMLQATAIFESPPMTIRLVRIFPPRGRLLDSDNLAVSMKAVRDGIADALGVDDGDPGLRWLYDQERGVGWGVRAEFPAGR